MQRFYFYASYIYNMDVKVKDVKDYEKVECTWICPVVDFYGIWL